MKYMPLFPQSPSRRAVVPFGIDLPGVECLQMGCTCSDKHTVDIYHMYHACVIRFHVYASMLFYLILI